MVTESFNLTEFNSSWIDMYVVVAENRDDEDGFNVSSINFTYEAVSFKDTELKLKLKFSSPAEISPLVVQDSLVMVIPNATVARKFFMSKTLLKPLHENYWVLKGRLPK